MTGDTPRLNHRGRSPRSQGYHRPGVTSGTPGWHGAAWPCPVPVPGFALARRDCGSSPEHRLFLSFKFRVQRERERRKEKKKRKGVKKPNLSSRGSERGSGAAATKG